MLYEGIFLITQRVFKLLKYLNNAYDSVMSNS